MIIKLYESSLMLACYFPSTSPPIFPPGLWWRPQTRSRSASSVLSPGPIQSGVIHLRGGRSPHREVPQDQLQVHHRWHGKSLNMRPLKSDRQRKTAVSINRKWEDWSGCAGEENQTVQTRAVGQYFTFHYFRKELLKSWKEKKVRLLLFSTIV